MRTDINLLEDGTNFALIRSKNYSGASPQNQCNLLSCRLKLSFRR